MRAVLLIVLSPSPNVFEHSGRVAAGFGTGRALLVERPRDAEKSARREAAAAAKREAQAAKRVSGGPAFTGAPAYYGSTLSGTPQSRCPPGVIPTFKPCCTGFEGGAIALRCQEGSICTRKCATRPVRACAGRRTRSRRCSACACAVCCSMCGKRPAPEEQHAISSRITAGFQRLPSTPWMHHHQMGSRSCCAGTASTARAQRPSVGRPSSLSRFAAAAVPSAPLCACTAASRQANRSVISQAAAHVFRRGCSAARMSTRSGVPIAGLGRHHAGVR